VGNPVKRERGKPRCCLCGNDFICRASHMTPAWRLRMICPLVAMRVTAGRRSPGPHTNPFTHSYWETEHTARGYAKHTNFTTYFWFGFQFELVLL